MARTREHDSRPHALSSCSASELFDDVSAVVDGSDEAAAAAGNSDHRRAAASPPMVVGLTLWGSVSTVGADRATAAWRWRFLP